MATERLIVKNFGPIQEADLDLRKVTVLIGEQASGKSVLAKLLAILRDPDFLQDSSSKKEGAGITFKDFEERLRFYDTDEFFNELTAIKYQCEDYEIDVYGKSILSSFKNSDLQLIIQTKIEVEKEDKSLERKGMRAFREKEFEKSASVSAERKVTYAKLSALEEELSNILFEAEYVPAERAMVAIGDSWYSENQYIDHFYRGFLDKRRMKKKFRISPLEIEFGFNSKSKENIVNIGDRMSHRLEVASNGIQALVPIFVSVETANPSLKYLFIIEEPELNLYPTTQKKLVEYLIEKCTKGDNRLIITTHSPYILTALNNCIEANNVLKSNPEAKDKVNKLVPPESQIAFEDVAAYFVANGTAKSIMNEEYQMIDANALDDVSEELARVYDSLLDLKYQPQD